MCGIQREAKKKKTYKKNDVAGFQKSNIGIIIIFDLLLLKLKITINTNYNVN